MQLLERKVETDVSAQPNIDLQVLYGSAKNRVERLLRAGHFKAKEWIACGPTGLSCDKQWAVERLLGTEIQRSPSARDLRIVDLFCGVGGFSAGLHEAALGVGLMPRFLAAVDLDRSALQVYRKNFSPQRMISKDVDSLVDYAIRFDGDQPRFAYHPEILDPSLVDFVGNTDIVVGGPPCQGHSNFNNHTRRNDPRNALYLTVPAVGVALGAPTIIIENVQSIVRSRGRLIETTVGILESQGYHVDSAVLEADKLGVAQTRKRHILFGTRGRTTLPFNQLYEAINAPALTVMDAIGDLQDVRPSTLFDSSAILSEENMKRVDYLFEKDTYDLPNSERPDCHKDGHSYPSVYGRMYPDKAAQTITGGFLSPGRGRFTHPTRRRALTPHEAARLQGFTDQFLFERFDGTPLSNRDYAKLIGDAVPPPVAFALGLAAVSSFPSRDW